MHALYAVLRMHPGNLEEPGKLQVRGQRTAKATQPSLNGRVVVY